VLERNWESANGQSQVAQIVIPQSRVKDILTELHGGLSGGHLGDNKILNKIHQRYYCLQQEAISRDGADSASVWQVKAPEPGIGAKYNSITPGLLWKE
jgi:hypothetical protein